MIFEKDYIGCCVIKNVGGKRRQRNYLGGYESCLDKRRVFQIMLEQ